MSESAIIELKNAIIRQADNIILTDVSLEIGKGEFVYLIGRVGSGKSSLLKTLYADLPLKDGSGKVVGYYLPMIKNKQVPFLRRKIGIIFQDFQLLTDRNIEDNLLFVLKATGWKNSNDIKSRISEVLEKVKMNNKGYKMPHELSGGEQQRVVIARALLNSPDIILADEPTGNLDPETSDDLVKLLHDISKSGKTIIMATHQHDLLKKFPARTIECKDGKVIELFNPDTDEEEEIELD
ncbi:ATP-binding cassette domain-containing protein [Labilibaculum sp. DW002]|uniref:ATP-binding cassette domain-containing protein n=1 Tax=Paralabilibaculum antarcticum TaxID=2912572 RepID=A0ABT5W1J7_9BACT|nr:ATP-binding cassette domain-containing protein [Labilibaculum sp. DW002]MDE5420449.1 ATP-binding cassette domain-containing protein [Labilibaculum sp. DW002]